jgi:hypothetical protein
VTQPDEPSVTDSPTKRHGDPLDEVVQGAPQGVAGPADDEDEAARDD